MEPAHYRELRKILMSSLDERGELSDEEIRSIIDDLVLGFSHENYLTVSERNTLSRELFSSVRKLDILQELIDDKDVTEIMVNGPERIYVEKKRTDAAVGKDFFLQGKT